MSLEYKEQPSGAFTWLALNRPLLNQVRPGEICNRLGQISLSRGQLGTEAPEGRGREKECVTKERIKELEREWEAQEEEVARRLCTYRTWEEGQQIPAPRQWREASPCG